MRTCITVLLPQTLQQESHTLPALMPKRVLNGLFDARVHSQTDKGFTNQPQILETLVEIN